MRSRRFIFSGGPSSYISTSPSSHLNFEFITAPDQPFSSIVLELRPEEAMMRLESGGSKQGVAVKVVAALEQGLAAFNRGGHSFDPKCQQFLVRDLHVLVETTQRMEAALKSRSAKNDEVDCEVMRASGECNNAIKVVQKNLSDVTARQESEGAAQVLYCLKIQELQRVINENDQNKLELQEHLKDVGKWWWVPFYDNYLLARVVIDFATRKEAKCDQRILRAYSEKRTTEEHLKESKALSDELTREKSHWQFWMQDLEECKDWSYRTKKASDARFTLIADAIAYYRQLRNAVENIEDNLDFSKALMEKLYSPRDLVMCTGDVRLGTLKDALIQLGDDCNQYLTREGEMPDNWTGGQLPIARLLVTSS